MLVESVAKDRGVPASEISVDRGVVSHAPSGRRATFGELLPKAKALTPPPQGPLKAPQGLEARGQVAAPRRRPGQDDGPAQFAMDVKLPAMLTALVETTPSCEH